MPYAVVLTTASKANLTGGAWADTIVANSGDSLSVMNFQNGGARIIEAWGIDSDSVAEIRFVFTRPESTHDQSLGFRCNIPAITPGGAGLVAAHNILPGKLEIPVFPSDANTIMATGTAADDLVLSYLTEYDDLPGAQAGFMTYDQVVAMRKSNLGVYVNPTASGTAGAYGATRAINADDDRFHADTYYAILGVSVQTQVTTIALQAPEWGSQWIGCPAGALDLRSDTWFVDQSIKRGRAMIPYFSANNKGNVLIKVADGEASTTPKCDFNLIELSGKPG